MVASFGLFAFACCSSSTPPGQQGRGGRVTVSTNHSRLLFLPAIYQVGGVHLDGLSGNWVFCVGEAREVKKASGSSSGLSFARLGQVPQHRLAVAAAGRAKSRPARCAQERPELMCGEALLAKCAVVGLCSLGSHLCEWTAASKICGSKLNHQN